MRILLDYPWYFVVFCLLLGAVYAVLLYRVGRGKERDESSWMTWLMSGLRMLAVSAIAFLLLSPLVMREQVRKERPIVIVAEDNSKSLDMCPDSGYYCGKYAEDVDALCKELGKDFDVHRYLYGSTLSGRDEVDGGVKDDATDISLVLDELADSYWHRNVGALILTGDGIYNKGRNPLTSTANIIFPVYTVAMGDTTVHRDASIANVRYNRLAYMGNSFPMDVTVNANRMINEKSTLKVRCDGAELYSEKISFTEERFTEVVHIMLDAMRPGVHNYEIEIVPLDNEQTVRNNRRTVSVEVIDGHQKIAIIAAAPHPDVVALRRAVESNQSYETDIFLAKDFNKNVDDYNLLILHQLPSKTAEAGLDISAIIKKGVPIMFVLGSQSDLGRLNALHAGLEVFTRIDRQNDVSALFNRDFSFFSVDDETVSQIESFPPLLSPFGDYKLSTACQTLFFSKVGNVNSKMPLVAAGIQGTTRYSFIAGEGLWRWRLADYQSNNSHRHFDGLINKLVTFTALRVNKERFRVEAPNVVNTIQPIVFEAQLYDNNYEPVNTPDVELTIGEHYFFNRTDKGYSINIGTLPPGHYKYSATTRLAGETFSASGVLDVEDLQLESQSLIADHSLLATLAAQNNGEMVEAHDVGSLASIIRSRDDMKTVIYSETKYSEMLNMPLLFILIILLLGGEWVLRKLNGEI